MSSEDAILEAISGLASGFVKGWQPFAEKDYENRLLMKRKQEEQNNEQAIWEKRLGMENKAKLEFEQQRPRRIFSGKYDESGQPVFMDYTGAATTQLKQDMNGKIGVAEQGKNERSNKNLIIRYQQGFRADPTYKTAEQISLNAGTLDNLIEEARRGNQVAFTASSTKMAKTMGEVGMLSEADVTRYTTAGSLTRGSADKLKKMMTGTATDLTLDDIKQIGFVLKDAANQYMNTVVDNHASQMSKNLGIPIEEAKKYLIPEQRLKPKKEIPIPTPQSNSSPIGLQGDKARRLQELRMKAQQGTLR